MHRLAEVDTEGDTVDRIRQRRGGELHPIDRVLLHSLPVADGWNTLLGAIRQRCSLPADLREMAVLRVAVLNGAAYEWQAHAPVALEAGLSVDQLAAVADGGDPAALSAVQRVVLSYTDAMTRQVTVPEDTFAAVRTQFTDQELLELTVTIAAYNMVSRVLVALHIGPDHDGTQRERDVQADGSRRPAGRDG